MTIIVPLFNYTYIKLYKIRFLKDILILYNIHNLNLERSKFYFEHLRIYVLWEGKKNFGLIII